METTNDIGELFKFAHRVRKVEALMHQLENYRDKVGATHRQMATWVPMIGHEGWSTMEERAGVNASSPFVREAIAILYEIQAKELES